MRIDQTFRWLLVPFAAWASWAIAVALGYGLYRGLESLCPPSAFDSGMCMAPWFEVGSKAVFAFGAALAAALIVVSTTLTAPSHRRTVVAVSLSVGAVVALAMAIAARAWLEFGAAVLSGLLAAAWIRRRV